MVKWLIRTIVGLFAIASLLFLFGRPVVQWGMILMAKDGFRDQHNTAGYPAPVLSSHDWAVAFCGKAGAPTLAELSHDSSITDEGRRQAAQIKDLIDSGAFDLYLMEPVVREFTPWQTRWLLNVP